MMHMHGQMPKASLMNLHKLLSHFHDDLIANGEKRPAEDCADVLETVERKVSLMPKTETVASSPLIDVDNVFRIPSENFKVQSPEMEKTLKALGQSLQMLLPANIGYTILLYDYGDFGKLFYMSTIGQQDSINVMKEFIDKSQPKQP